MRNTIDERYVAELEAAARAATVKREAAESRSSQSHTDPVWSAASLSRAFIHSGDPRAARAAEANADRQAALARAVLERQKRERAEAATAAMVAANREMADASRSAAISSADAARWAKWAAVATAVAAVVTLVSTLVQLFVQPPHAMPDPAPALVCEPENGR